MPNSKQFKFSRGRGIVWLCDVADSSKHLNTNEGANLLEEFLPRFYWTSSILVEAAGGKYLKWTGDGFLAWFDVTLHREMGLQAAKVFEALWHLSILVNVTQLAVAGERKFRIRHGVTYEQDALLIEINESDGSKRLDIIGRAVVLAFRLSGISAAFPHVMTHGEVVSAYNECNNPIVNFKRWRPNKDDRLRYFKAERWGTRSLFMSGERRRRKRPMSTASILRMGKRVIASAEGADNGKDDAGKRQFVSKFFDKFGSGPEWCRKVTDRYTEYLRKDMLGTLKEFVQAIESMPREKLPEEAVK